MHGKERQVAPAFTEFLGAELSVPVGIDTDQFGTFSGDIARVLSPVDAARAKARLAMSAADSPYALASEATYGPLPGLGLPGHEELLLFVDDTRSIEIVEGQRELHDFPATLRARTLADAEPLLTRINFGMQAVIVRSAQGERPDLILKGITSLARLRDAIREAAEGSADGHALVEVDLRAHHNPSRRIVLTALGHRLARRLATPCPGCGCPGYGRTSTRIGLPCATCGWPTDLATADIHSCAQCSHRHAAPRPEAAADPRWCDCCNP